MAVDYFLKIDGIGGGGAGQVSSPKLFDACATGNHSIGEAWSFPLEVSTV